jgi:hypothetical protein
MTKLRRISNDKTEVLVVSRPLRFEELAGLVIERNGDFSPTIVPRSQQLPHPQ